MNLYTTIKKDKSALFLAFFICLNLICLSFASLNLSISYNEASIFYDKNNIFSYILNFFVNLDLFPRDLSLRLFFIIIHIFNILFIFIISNKILNNKNEALLSTVIYMFLPGVLASAILIESAGLIIFFSLLSVYFVQIRKNLLLTLILFISIFINGSFFILYLAIFFYGLYKHDKFHTFLGIFLFAFWIICYDFNIGGKPSGHILDTFGVYGAVFSPFIFMYFIYAIYRIWIKDKKTFLWFISISAFLLSLVLSTRQSLPLEIFLPYTVIFIPFMVKIFFNSYKVRLPIFRTRYKILGIFLLITLFINSYFIIFFSTINFDFLHNHRHFAYKFDMAKNLAIELSKNNIDEINSDNETALRLKFYGIENGGELFLKQDKQDCKILIKKIEVKDFNHKINDFYICKIK